jgi:hypothetical protein
MRLLLLSVCLFLSSCYTQQKATNQIKKAKEKFPSVVSKKAAEWFPCKTIKVKSDSVRYKTVIRKIKDIDTTYLMDTLFRLDTILIEKNCTKVLYKYREVLKEVPAVHDTIIQLDSAKLFTLTYERDAALLDKSKMEVKYKVFLKISFWLFLILILALLYASRKKLY